MSQKWYRKVSVQASTIVGVFLLSAAIVIGVFGLLNTDSKRTLASNQEGLTSTYVSYNMYGDVSYPFSHPIMPQTKLNEFISILGNRADHIIRIIGQSPCYFGDKSKSIEEFERLHREHIQSLIQENLILAHEILNRIHVLLTELNEQHCLEVPRPQ